MMAADASFLDYVQDQLGELAGAVSVRAMFGGHGLYLDGAFFAIVYDGRLYFRTDETTRERYAAAGTSVFTPPKGPAIRSYYEVPPDVLDDRSALAEWAREAAATA